jgi:hypothetical protein
LARFPGPDCEAAGLVSPVGSTHPVVPDTPPRAASSSTAIELLNQDPGSATRRPPCVLSCYHLTCRPGHTPNMAPGKHRAGTTPTASGLQGRSRIREACAGTRPLRHTTRADKHTSSREVAVRRPINRARSQPQPTLDRDLDNPLAAWACAFDPCVNPRAARTRPHRGHSSRPPGRTRQGPQEACAADACQLEGPIRAWAGERRPAPGLTAGDERVRGQRRRAPDPPLAGASPGPTVYARGLPGCCE